MTRATKKSGFKLLWGGLALEGTLVLREIPQGAKQTLLQVRGSTWLVTLAAGASKAQQATWQRLARWAKKGKVAARIAGRFGPAKGHPLVVTEAARLARKRKTK